MLPRSFLPLAIAFVAVTASCATVPFRLPFTGNLGDTRTMTQDELSDELNAYAARFAGLVSTVAEEISAGSDDSLIRRRALLWSLRMNPAVHEAAFLPNPQMGYVRAVTITVMMRRYFQTGDGRSMFGPFQELAVSTAATLEADIIEIGAQFLTASELAETRREVDEIAARFPIQGTQFSLVRAHEATQAVRSSNVLSEVMTLPLAPFRALQGVDTGAAAIRDFNQTARRFATIVTALPEEFRGEMQLLLLDAEDLRGVQQGLAAFESAAASADRASLAMEQMPSALQAVLDEQVRSILVESEGTIGQAARTVAEARELAAPLQETALQLREATVLWREILGPHDPAPRGPDERPFDIREWQTTAQAIHASAAELRALAAELQGFSGSAGVDRMFWRAVTLLAAFFVMLLVYRVLAARLLRRE
ncbi:hypothetical protein KJ059_02445 [Myxococcota bacterium]|nr:hypothetical protein [Myxococcota bacterium]MCZ7619804.1 hypothetical protein [Myxococcota bacterium]